MKTVNFWNGNKSVARQEHELKLLEQVIGLGSETGNNTQIINDLTDYPSAEDEGNIFNTGADILVTVAGNQKFEESSFIPVNIPLAKGILGKRILIIRQEDSSLFAHIDEQELKQLRSGIPATWADADLFRYNNYKVVEKGLFEEIFQRLKNRECDYVALGANEVKTIFNQMAINHGDLRIEKNLLLSYPLPLVFYVHPQQQKLADLIERGLNKAIELGKYDALFEQFYGDCMQSLKVRDRKEFSLVNPLNPLAIC